MRDSKVLASDEEIRGAVEAAGWTFVRFGGRGLTVNGRELDVVRFKTTKDGLTGWVTVVRGDGAFDRFIEHVELSPTVVSAVRATTTLRVGVDVRDSQCALEVLGKLTTVSRADGFLGYVAAISELGWNVDRDRMWDNDYDFTWSIPARRGEDSLAFGALFSGASDNTEPLHISESGGARMVGNGVSWSVDVRLTAPARELADALLRG